jgi:hypothetical protein
MERKRNVSKLTFASNDRNIKPICISEKLIVSDFAGFLSALGFLWLLPRHFSAAAGRRKTSMKARVLLAVGLPRSLARSPAHCRSD